MRYINPRFTYLLTYLPTHHHSIFTGRMLLLTPNQQCQMHRRQYYRVAYIYVCGGFVALLWTAPELMASQRSSVDGLSTGTQKGDVYSFAIILHEILYRAGLFRCGEDDEPIPPKSELNVSPIPILSRFQSIEMLV